MRASRRETRDAKLFGVRLFTNAANIFLLIISIVLVAYSAIIHGNQHIVLQQADQSDWKAVEEALGKTGALQPGDVYKVSFPRSDLKVTVAGVELKPALALGTWVAFKRIGAMAMVMGD